MNALTDRFDSTLEPLGVGVGVFLVLVGIGTIAGTPWTIKELPPALLQVLGALATGAIGAGLAYLSWTR